MNEDRKTGYADAWIVVWMVMTELLALAFIALYGQNEFYAGWRLLFWCASVVLPVLAVGLEVLANLAIRPPRPFQWKSIGASALFLALCGVVNALLTYRETQI